MNFALECRGKAGFDGEKAHGKAVLVKVAGRAESRAHSAAKGLISLAMPRYPGR